MFIFYFAQKLLISRIQASSYVVNIAPYFFFFAVLCFSFRFFVLQTHQFVASKLGIVKAGVSLGITMIRPSFSRDCLLSTVEMQVTPD